MYHKELQDIQVAGDLQLPFIPDYCEHNGHMYYILTKDSTTRAKLIEYLKKKGILSVFHYVPLHSSPAGKNFAKIGSTMQITDSISDRLLRLPLYYDIADAEVRHVIDSIHAFFKKNI